MTRPCIKCGSSARNARGDCKMCNRATNAAWRTANPEKCKARSAKHRASNPEKTRARSAAWRAENPTNVKVNFSAWVKKNPEAMRVHEQNRRAREIASGGKLSRGLSKKLYALQKGKCACCKQPLGAGYHLDHIMPLVLGGTNTDNNIQLLRQRCNNQKHAKHPIDFMQLRGFLL